MVHSVDESFNGVIFQCINHSVTRKNIRGKIIRRIMKMYKLRICIEIIEKGGLINCSHVFLVVIRVR